MDSCNSGNGGLEVELQMPNELDLHRFGLQDNVELEAIEVKRISINQVR